MKNIFMLLLCFSINAAFAQLDSTKNTVNLDEVVFSANKIKENTKTISQQIKIIGRTEIQTINATTTGDLLANIGSVAFQKSQQGGGSPVIRGFEASRVVLMIDGVRMNNLIYRAGHLQNIVTIDQSILERAEVLFGPASTVYGSDALGGVIHFYTKDPKLNSASADGYIRIRMPNQEKTLNGILNIGGKKWASLSSFTASSFNNLKMGAKTNPSFGEQFGLRNHYVYVNNTSGYKPDELANNLNPLIQLHSGYEQLDLLQKILFKPNETDNHILNIQYSTSSDVPRYDRLTDPLNKDGSGLKSAEWYYGPQKRFMTAYNFRKTEATKGYRIGANYQTIEESRHDRPFNGQYLRNRIENVDVFGFGADYYKNNTKYEVRYGIDVQYNTLKSTADQTSISGLQNKRLNTRYPDGKNSLLNMAIYTTESWIINEKIRINDGIRIGFNNLKSEFIDKTFYPFPFNTSIQKNLVYSGNIGVIYTPNISWKIYGLLSSGFRAPNVDDLSKVFESSKGTLIVPNPDLKPEKTINWELGITKTILQKVNWENVIYTTLFKDAIVTDASTLNGQSTVIYDGVISKVLANQNKRKADIWGFSSTLNGEVTKYLTASFSYNYTKGRIDNGAGVTKSPLDHIPPSFGRFGLKYYKSKVAIETFVLWNGWKNIKDYLLNGEDNEQYATPKGMPSWKTLNVRASFNFTKIWAIQAGVDNLFDLQYRTFSSGINAPGRNLFLTLRGGFGK
jgi:hemoglobin/transferrin/lactoferrin receptor protein